MSGRKIDDHSFWAGGKGSASVFPDGPHKVKMESSAEGAGEVDGKYPDTTEQIKSEQVRTSSHTKSQAMKPGYRY